MAPSLIALAVHCTFRGAHSLAIDLAVVAAQYEREPSNEAWAADASALIRKNVEASEWLRDSMGSLDCRSSSCRLEIFDDGSGKVGKGLPLFLNQFGDTLPVAQADHREEGEGRMTYTLYMTARDSELALAQAGTTPAPR